MNKKTFYGLHRQELDNLANLLKEKEALDAKIQKSKALILEEMEMCDINSVSTPRIRIQYVSECIRESFDTRAFKQDLPGVYSRYLDRTFVHSHLSCKLK